jgi:hypothetical protein
MRTRKVPASIVDKLRRIEEAKTSAIALDNALKAKGGYNGGGQWEHFAALNRHLPPNTHDLLADLVVAAENIRHWHDTLCNKETGECEGMVVSAKSVHKLWEVLEALYKANGAR